MGDRSIAARTERYCDRCNKPVPKFEDLRKLTKIVTKETRLRWGVAYFGRNHRPEVLTSNIDFCQECWDEFLDLFLQGKAVHSAVKHLEGK